MKKQIIFNTTEEFFNKTRGKKVYKGYKDNANCYWTDTKYIIIDRLSKFQLHFTTDKGVKSYFNIPLHQQNECAWFYYSSGIFITKD